LGLFNKPEAGCLSNKPRKMLTHFAVFTSVSMVGYPGLAFYETWLRCKTITGLLYPPALKVPEGLRKIKAL
jgi:hypothetical protein